MPGYASVGTMGGVAVANEWIPWCYLDGDTSCDDHSPLLWLKILTRPT